MTTASIWSSLISLSAPGRGSSWRPSSRFSTNRRRHLPMVVREERIAAAIATSLSPAAHRSMIFARNARWRAVRTRIASPFNEAASSEVSVSVCFFGRPVLAIIPVDHARVFLTSFLWSGALTRSARRQPRVEGEDVPALRFHAALRCSGCIACVISNGARPKRQASAVGCGHAHDPTAGQAIPEQLCRSGTHTRTALTAQHEELSHVEDFGVVTQRRAALRQSEADQLIAPANQERIASLRLAPVGRERRIAKATVSPQSNGKRLAQIVDVQLEQVCEQASLGFAREIETNRRG